MKIKDLPPPIKRLAKRNVEKQRDDFFLLLFKRNLELRHSFVWNDTIEGYEYWYQVDNGNFHFEPRKEVKL